MNRLSLLLSVSLLLACSSSSETPAPAGAREIHIEVNQQGYSPAEVRAPANAAVRLVFTRTADDGCGAQLVFPTLDIRRDLPLNEPVPVDVTMPASGALAFTCGMDMYRGAVIAQ